MRMKMTSVGGYVLVDGRRHDVSWVDGVVSLGGVDTENAFLNVLARLTEDFPGAVAAAPIPAQAPRERSPGEDDGGEDPYGDADGSDPFAFPPPVKLPPEAAPTKEAAALVEEFEKKAATTATNKVDVGVLCRLNTFAPLIEEFRKAGLGTYVEMLDAAEQASAQVPMLLSNEDWRDRLRIAAMRAGVEGASA